MTTEQCYRCILNLILYKVYIGDKERHISIAELHEYILKQRGFEKMTEPEVKKLATILYQQQKITVTDKLIGINE